MKILAVDDEYMQLRLLEKAIREAVPECDLTCFENSVEALGWAKENRVDIAFCDIQMPVMTGIELGKELKKLNPKVNIIFVTGYYEDYAVDAISLHFSGYLNKPVTTEAVAQEMENLRFPIEPEKKSAKLRVQCFGNFEVYAGNMPLRFERRKSKELFAYLIDRHGAQITCGEVCAAIYDNDENEGNNKSDLRKCASDIRKTLKEVDAEDVFVKGYNSYAINVSELSCDFYDWEKNEPYAIRAFRGEYMSQYSWGEDTLGSILEERRK